MSDPRCFYGPHIIEGAMRGNAWPGIRAFIQTLNSRSALVVNHAETVAMLRTEFPDLLVFARRWAPHPTEGDDCQHWYEDGAISARRVFEYVNSDGAVIGCGNNEPRWSALGTLAEQLDDLKRVGEHAVQFHEEARRLGFAGCCPQFGWKHPRVGVPEEYPIIKEWLDEVVALGGLIGMHPYSPGPMRERSIVTPAGTWNITKLYWQENVDLLIGMNPNVRIALTEVGSNAAYNNDGSRIEGTGPYHEIGTSGQAYAFGHWWQYDSIWRAYGKNLVCAHTFCWGHDPGADTPPWINFDVSEDTEFLTTMAGFVWPGWSLDDIWMDEPDLEPEPEPQPDPEPTPEPEPAPTTGWYERLLLILAEWLRAVAAWLENKAAGHP